MTPAQEPCTVSVVIVSFNSANTIGEAISSIWRHLPSSQITVVDNGSTDDTRTLVQQMPGVLLVHGQGNVGFGAGVNLGARESDGDLLLILNPDATIVASRVDKMWTLAGLSSVGLVACQLHSAKGRARYLKHTEWGWRRELGWAALRWFLLPHELPLRRPAVVKHGRRPWISAAACIVGRAEFLSIGGFDEELFLYFEDYDLSRRYREGGATVGTTDAITFSHQGQGSAQDGVEQIEAWALLSLLSLVAKWDGFSESIRAARATLRLLSGIAVMGQVARRLPRIGRRAAKKGHSASLVRAMILECVDRPPVPHTYETARAAVASATDTAP